MQKRSKLVKMIAPAVLSAVLVTGGMPLTAFAQENVNSNSVSVQETVADGIYDASGYVDNYDYNVLLKVTVAGGKVTAIENTTTDYGAAARKNQSYTEKAVEGINSAITANPVDSVDAIDTVSGATYSSNAIKQAIASTLGQSFEAEKTEGQGERGEGEKGEGEQGESSKGESGDSERPQVSAPDGYVTYTVTLNAEGQHVVKFATHPEEGDTVSMSMMLVVDDTGKKMIKVDDEPADVEGYFTYNPETEEFTITNESLEKVEAIFSSETYGRIHFDVDLNNITETPAETSEETQAETAAQTPVAEKTETVEKAETSDALAPTQNTVNTGDHSSMTLWACALIAAAGVVVCLSNVIFGKRNR